MAGFKPLRLLVKSLVGRDDTSLTVEEAKQAKELNPETYADYVALKKEFNKAWQAARTSYIESHNVNGLANYTDVLKFLEAKGFPNVISHGFIGKIDASGKWHTESGLAIQGVPSAVMFPSVVMNPAFGKKQGDNWVFQAVRADGTKGGHFYTDNFKKQTIKTKYEKVGALAPQLDKIRAKWFAYVKKFDVSNALCVASVELELIYQFLARVGTPGNSTYGISTLRVKHLTITPQGIIIKYRGKDSVLTTHKLSKTDTSHKYLIKAILELVEEKESKDLIFTVTKPTGRQIPVSATLVNKAFQHFGANGVTVHKMRTIKGTGFFIEAAESLLASNKRPKNAREAMVAYKAIAMQVGKLLNHVRRTSDGTKITGTTALNSYVDPFAQVQYWTELDFPIPKFLEKFDVS